MDKPLSLGEEINSSSSKNIVTDRHTYVNTINSVSDFLLTRNLIGESTDADLKQIRLTLSDKPLPLGEELDSSSSKSMVTDKQNDVNITNSVFESLLARGAIEESKTHRDIGDRIERYTVALSKLEKLNEIIVSEDLKVSNDTFIQNEKSPDFIRMYLHKIK